MKKSRVVLVMALVLIIAMICGIVVGCSNPAGPNFKPGTGTGSGDGNTDKGDGTDDGDITIGGGEIQKNVVTISDKTEIDLFRSFELNSNLSETEVRGRVTVTEIGIGQIEAVVNRVAEGAASFKVYPPNGGWNFNSTYQINIGSGITFKDYAKATGIKFTVNSNKIQEIYEKDGVIEFSAGSTVLPTPVYDENGVETGGSMVLQTNGVSLSKGDIFIATTAEGKKSAYKVESNDIYVNGATSSFSYSKPQMDEVYKTFKYDNEDQLNQDSNIELTYTDEIEEELANSELATLTASLFGSAPTFNVGVEVIGNALKITITITIPNVVKVDGLGSTNLVLTVSDTMAATSDSKINAADLIVGYDLTAKITNDIECKVSIDSYAAVDEISNVQDLINKLHELASASSSDELVPPISLFRWTLPIASGAADITYDAKLVFRFAFTGSFSVTAKASLDYELQAKYSNVTGLKVTTSDLTTTMDDLDLELKGNVTVKVGIIQELSLNILQGVLGVGIIAEIGNYNRLYGYIKADDLINNPDHVVGGVYFEGGFYYNVALNLSVNLFGLINLANQRIEIASGEIKGYEAGNRELILSIEDTKYANVQLGALENALPQYEYNIYDLVAGNIFNRVIPTSELVVTPISGGEYVTFSEGNVTINPDYRASTFEVEVAVSLASDPKAVINTIFTYNGAMVLDQSNYAYDKAADNGLKMILTMTGIEGTPVVTCNGKVVASQYIGKELIFAKRDINKLNSGVNVLVITVDGISVQALVTTTGLVGLYDGLYNGIYEIYSADQLVDMQKQSDSKDFAGEKFIIIDDIDMNGLALAPIANFAGVLMGKEGGVKISNYSINKTLPDGNAAFFLTNSGIISNVKFTGDVNVSGIAGNGGKYNIGGVVAVNNGQLTNVSFEGKINVSTTATLMGVNYNIGGVAAVNADNATLTSCAAAGEINISVLLDVLNVNFNVGGLTSTIGSKDTKISATCTLGKFTFTKINYAEVK